MAGEQEPVIKITSGDLELQGQDGNGHMTSEQGPVIKITPEDLGSQDVDSHNQPDEQIDAQVNVGEPVATSLGPVDEQVADKVVIPEMTEEEKAKRAEAVKQEVDRTQQEEREGWLDGYLQEELGSPKNVVVHESPNNHLIIEITNMEYKATVPVPAEMFAALQAYQAGNTTQAPRDIIRGYASELKEAMAQGLKEILSNHPDIKPTLEAPDWLDWELQKDNEEISQRKRGVIKRLYRKITGQA